MVDQPTGTVTLLFTDIEGSTSLLAEVGRGAYADLLATQRRLLGEAFDDHGGYVVDSEGDSFFVAFSAAPDAVAAAAEAQAALAAFEWPGGRQVRVRMGMHSGRPLVTAPKYVGLEVHRAARVMATAHGRQVVLTEATARLAEQELPERVELHDLGQLRIRDFDGPVRLFQLGHEAFPPLKTPANTNLPTPVSSFLGREDELEDAAVALLRSRLVTVVGPGGQGKTRFALELARRMLDRRADEYRDGVFFVPLAPVREAELVPEEIRAALGADDVAAAVGDRHVLILLDNFEQVVAAAPALGGLLGSCSNLTLLVTSRELLRIAGERAFELPPLADGDGIELFCERARVERDGEVARLVARLEGLPLAIELAAARASVLGPGRLLERLGQRLDLLRGGRDADPRQQTLRATIDWSYDLLDPPERELFARLSCFAGGCTLEAAEAVAGADLDVLQSLVDKSLVRYRDDRYWMLETIREYATEQLEASPAGSEVIRRRHLDWFLELATRTELESRAGDRDACFDRLAADHDNLRAALTAAGTLDDAGPELELATALWRFWAGRGFVEEGLRRLEFALSRSSHQPLEARLGVSYLGQMASRSAMEILPEVEAIAAAAGGEAGRFTRVGALILIGLLELTLSGSGAAEPVLEEAVSLAGDDYPAERAEAIGWLLIAALYGPLPADQGIARCRAAVEQAGGNRTVEAFALVERAALEAMRGDIPTARTLLADGREIFRELDLTVFDANTAQEGYFVEMLAGNPAGAVADLRAAFDRLAETGERGFRSTVAGYLAHAWLAVGDLQAADGAARLSEDAAGPDDWTSQSLWRMARARLLALDGGHDEALRLASVAVEVLQPGMLNMKADRLVDLAGILALAGRPEEAAGVLRDALALYEQKGNVVSAAEVRSALGETEI
ncbi:MAG TPA: adenylate/guanylate cyclase domain-containing protein [Gaiellaceae bacterium]|nr:adenylate/guanylate cyclase domain-containing protein [Gaiellaceae bacterium]